jgi:hypothetical protein
MKSGTRGLLEVAFGIDVHESSAESTIGMIKVELFGDRVPDDIHQVQSELFPYIEGFYNRQRQLRVPRA